MSSKEHINCDWVLERIEAYIDDELRGEDAGALQHHVADCAACASELDFARSVVLELRSLPQHTAPYGIVENALNRAAPVVGVRSRLSDWFQERLAVALRPAMVAMLVVVAAVTVFVLTQRDDGNLNGVAQHEYTDEEIEIAKNQAMLAFAYVSKYSRRTGGIIRKDVMGERVVPAMKRAINESRDEVTGQKRVRPVVERALLDAIFVETKTKQKRSKQ